MSTRLIKFAAVGIAGFLADVSVLTGLMSIGIGPLAARLASFAVAVTVTWYLNRRVTFGDLDTAWVSQWSRFVSVNAIGGLINYAVFAVFLATSPIVAANPVLGVAAGSVAGLVWNFAGSSRVVFRVQH